MRTFAAACSLAAMNLSPRIYPALGMVAAVLLAVAPFAHAQQRDPKLDKALQNAHGGSRERVIVRFRPGSESSVEQKVLSRGNRIFAKHPSIGAFTAELRADELAAFARDPNIETIGSDADVSPDATTSDTSISTNVLRATLGESQSSKAGTGIGVAVIDSGIAPIPAFNGRITAFYDVTTGVPIATLPSDEYGHGTHVAGLIGANDSNYMGVAPAVTFVGLKVLNK